MLYAEKHEILFERKGAQSGAAVTVAMTCYKSAELCIEAIESVFAQTEPHLNLVILDDCSPDDSAATLCTWLERKSVEERFDHVLLLRHETNQGLAQARNTGAAAVTTPYIFILDGDNILYPRALSVLRGAIENSGCPMAYCLLEKFGDEEGIMGNSVWTPEKFAYENYIDAMTMLRTDILSELGGYRALPFSFGGWEDYDLWCSFVDRGLTGCHVPQILCRYRVRRNSMLRVETSKFLRDNLERVRADFEKHHSFKFHF